MPKLVVVTRDGEEQALESESGLSVMRAIRNSGNGDLPAVCGGCCICGTCHVYVDPVFLEKLPLISKNEVDVLDTLDYRTETSRLACQIPMSVELDGLRVTIAPQD